MGELKQKLNYLLYVKSPNHLIPLLWLTKHVLDWQVVIIRLIRYKYNNIQNGDIVILYKTLTQQCKQFYRTLISELKLIIIILAMLLNSLRVGLIWTFTLHIKY